MKIRQMTHEKENVIIQTKQIAHEKPKINNLELLFSENDNLDGFEIEIKIKVLSKMTNEIADYLAVNMTNNITRVFNNYEPK
jgi:chaperonin GroEL (HSP60 family)